MSVSRSDQRADRLSRVGGGLVDAFAALVQAWRDGVYVQERLLAAQRPWEREGPLRWRRELGGHRLDGAYLPAAYADCYESVADPARSKRGAGW